MNKRNWSGNLIAILMVLFLVSGSVAQDKKKKKEQYNGTPVLWESVNIESRDLYLGPGGARMRPNLRRVTFIKEEKGGYSTKYRIKDGSGREWVAKVGKESQPETAAVRLLWGIGYKTEVNYLVPKLKIPGKGTFTNVRLEARPDNVKRLDEWEWKKNPFVGTNELQGLKVVMVLLNNWDLKDSNNQIFFVRNGDRDELQYVISDLGATFGKTGSLPVLWRLQRSRNEPADYVKSKFIDKVEDGRIDFHNRRKMDEMFDDITVEQAHWIAGLLSQLSDKQIRDAFRAANYRPAEIRMLSQAVKRRITELNRVAMGRQLESKR